MVMENYRKLGARMRRFAELMAAGETAAEAVRIVRPRTKCAKQQGYIWKRIPRVAAAIEELEEQAVEDAGITRKQILLDANTIKRRCMQAEPVLDREGNAAGEYRFDSAGANKANEMLGRYHKLWTEKHELAGAGGGQLIPGGGFVISFEDGVPGGPIPGKPTEGSDDE